MLLTTLQTARLRASRRSAFTLIEVLVVVAILVILAGIATVATTRYLEDTRKSKAVLQAKQISNAIEAYINNPANPDGTPPDDLMQLAEPSFGTSFLKDGRNDLRDPWGGEFQVKQQQGNDGGIVYIVYTQSRSDGVPVSQYGIGGLSRVGDQ